jgi:ABC-type multidrug transport system ATPase subunit
MELPELVARHSQESHAFIEVAQLTKRFAEVAAVYQISFGGREGELFGLL